MLGRFRPLIRRHDDAWNVMLRKAARQQNVNLQELVQPKVQAAPVVIVRKKRRIVKEQP